MKKIVDWIVASLLAVLLAIVQMLPAEKSIKVLEKLTRRIALLLPRSKLAVENLKITFPEKPKEEVEGIVRNMWGQIARTVGEYAFLKDIVIDENKIEIVDNDMFEKVKKRKKGAIFFTAHTGNWEIIPPIGKQYGLDISILFRMPNNPYLAKRLVKARGHGGRLIPAGLGAANALMNVLEKNGIIGLLVDQALDRGPTLEFLGRKASVNPLIVKLAEKADCEMYPIRCIRLPKGRFKIEIEKSIKVVKDKEGKVDMMKTLEKINSIIERWVREYPDQWLWLHNRWKRR